MITRSIMEDLTDREVELYSKELARITTSLSELEDEKKAIMSAYKDKIDRGISDTRILARKISMKQEMREIKCRWEFDPKKVLALLRREDTNETLETRPMTENELQMKLPEGGKKNG